MYKSTILQYIFFGAFILFFLSCSEDDNDDNNQEYTAVTELTILEEPNSLPTNTILQLTVNIVPEDATNSSIIWTSSDTDIATVNDSGLVTGIQPGTVTIRATADDNSNIRSAITFQVVENTANRITSLSINNVPGTIEDNTITVVLPLGTDITALQPVIVHNGTNIIPALNFIQDFTSPVTYTVSGTSNIAREWTVIVSVTDQIEAGSAFITTWNAQTITIPTDPAYSYNYQVDWDNDGNVDQLEITGDVTHTFSTSGEHTIRIVGTFPAIDFGADSAENERTKITSLGQWGTIEWLSMQSAFSGCSNLRITATDIPDLSRVSDLSYMFFDTNAANPNVRSWNTTNITTMEGMFRNAKAATPDVSLWDTSNVINMKDLFRDINRYAGLPVSQWNTDNVTDMSGMFRGVQNANPNVSNWDTSQVIDMSYMFANTFSANPDVSKWDTSNVTNMASMFFFTSSASPDVSEWNVSNVVNMSLMFSSASIANPQVANWNVEKVVTMSSMFFGTPNANPDVSNWTITQVNDMSNMFINSGLSTDNYDALLINFASQGERRDMILVLDMGTVNYCTDDANTARQVLVNWNWVITDGGRCHF